MGWGGDSNPSLRITTVDAQPSYPNAARGGFEPPTIALTGRCTTSCAIWQRLGTEDSNPHAKVQNLVCCRYTNPESEGMSRGPTNINLEAISREGPHPFVAPLGLEPSSTD